MGKECSIYVRDIRQPGNWNQFEEK
jgi:hypothetical protein